MLTQIVRPSTLAAITIFLSLAVGCQNSSDNINSTTNKTNSSAGNSTVQTENAKNDMQEISDLLDQYNDALLKKDAVVLDRIWADDLSFVNLRGDLLTKKNRIDNIKTGATALKSADASEKQVRMYGDTGIGTLLVKIDGQYSGEEGSGAFRVTTVWAKPKGTWQMVAVQMTPIAK